MNFFFIFFFMFFFEEKFSIDDFIDFCNYRVLEFFAEEEKKLYERIGYSNLLKTGVGKFCTEFGVKLE